jgi:protein CpxP
MKVSMTARLGLAIAGLLLAGSAWAQAPAGGMERGPGFGAHHPPFEKALGPMGNHGRWWNDPMMVERLKLTDAQRKSMDDTLFQHRETLVDLQGSVEKAELAMEPLMRDDQPNEAKILAQIDKLAQARAELEKANARFLLAIRGKLTPEQWKQLEADRTNRGPQRHGWGAGSQGQGGQRTGRQGQARPGMSGQFQRRQTTPPSQPAPQGAAPQGSGPQGTGPQGRLEQGPEPGGLEALGVGADQ